MLSNYVAGHGCVLIVDHGANLGRFAKELTASLLPSSNTSAPVDIKILPTTTSTDTFEPANDDPAALFAQLQITDSPQTILIKVAEFTQLHSHRTLFHLVHSLKQCARIRQVFLWVAERCLLPRDSSPTAAAVIVPYLQHMAGAVLRLQDSVNMSVLTKKAGGAVGKKLFAYEVHERRFVVREVQREVRAAVVEETVNPESLTTFKINVGGEDEEEARTALKLPYERTSEAPPQESRIIYNPDSDDDFDEEDPDDDLNI